MLTILFQNVREYLIVNNGVNFAEAIAPWNEISQLYQLEFDESGSKIRSILESVYTDGITGFENVKVDGDKITGIFLDTINAGLTKRYQFSVSVDQITYKLLNPDDIDQNADYSEVNFAATKMFGGSSKSKNCVKGTRCGNGCISKEKACSKAPAPEEKKEIAAIIGKGKGKNGAWQTTASNTFKRVEKGEELTIDTKQGSVRLKYIKDKDVNYLKMYKEGIDKPYSSLLMPTEKLKKYIDDIYNPKVAEHYDPANPRFEKDVNKAKEQKSTSTAKTTNTKVKNKTVKLQDPRTHSIETQKDFNELALYTMSQLKNKYADEIPIFELRRAIGESVKRDDFNRFLLKMQADDKIYLRSGDGGKIRGDISKIEDSISLEGRGLLLFVKPEIDEKEIENIIGSNAKKYQNFINNPPPLDELGSAREIANGKPIKNQKDFNIEVDKAYAKLDDEFNQGGLVSIGKLRKVFEQRVQADEFDKLMNSMIPETKYRFSEAAHPTEEQEKDGVKTIFGRRHYLTKDGN